ncbi:hypothetical protein [Sporohalobacter salinus]
MRRGELTNQEVYNDSGHGVYIASELTVDDGGSYWP